MIVQLLVGFRALRKPLNPTRNLNPAKPKALNPTPTISVGRILQKLSPAL